MAKFVMLATFLAISMVIKTVYCLAEEDSSTSKSEPACLLQSQFSSSDLSVDAAGVVEAMDETSLVLAPNSESALLIESDVMEETAMSKLMVRSIRRSRSCKAHLAYLNRKTHGLEHARNVSNKKMDELVNGFISKQSGSQDACSSQLMEAKHQLNQIHDYVMDLATQVNTTERAIVALDAAMEEKIKEVETLDKWKEDELAKCEKKKQEYIEMYAKLSGEMKEMKQIASPGVAMDVKTGTVITAGLLQMKSPPTATQDMQQLQMLITGTQTAAKQLLHCMAHHSHQQEQISQLQGSVVVDSFEVRDVNWKGKGKGGKYRLSKKKKSCEESWGWDTASVDQVADWCGCDTSKKSEKKWCLCPSKLSPLLGKRGKWTIFGLKGGQAMGKGYEYSVKYSPKGAEKTAIDLCVQKPEIKPVTSPSVTVKPPEKHVDPPGAIGGGMVTATIKPMTIPPPEKHVDPPGAIGGGMVTATVKPVTIPPTPTESHVDPVDDSEDGDDDEDPGDMDGEGEIMDDEGNFGAGARSLGFEPAIGKMNVDSLRDNDDQAAMDAAKAVKAGASTPEECAKEKQVLEETYVKTYVELSRLKDEYNELANSTACFDTVESTYKSRKAPLQEKIDELIKDIDKKQRELAGLRPRLESATKAEAALRKQIATLTAECAELPETVSNLDKVRDAIQALSKCPGLARVQFSLPKWTGTWVSLHLKAKKMTDDEQDAALDAACNKAAAGTRAAETGEIAEQTVEGIPETNTAEFPLVGACPNCEGDEAKNLPSGHKRICWRQGKALTQAAKVTNCASGKKAILCVTDRENIRQIPGGQS